MVFHGVFVSLGKCKGGCVKHFEVCVPAHLCALVWLNSADREPGSGSWPGCGQRQGTGREAEAFGRGRGPAGNGSGKRCRLRDRG